MSPSFEYRHVVTFEDTNVVGNVYYTNHIKWQGHCRELFLRQHIPEIAADIADGLALATLRCSCEYFSELAVFDEVIVRVELLHLTQQRMTLAFEYLRAVGGEQEVVARGEQEIACLRRKDGVLRPAAFPVSLQQALEPFAGAL